MVKLQLTWLPLWSRMLARCKRRYVVCPAMPAACLETVHRTADRLHRKIGTRRARIRILQSLDRLRHRKNRVGHNRLVARDSAPKSN